MGFSSPLFLSLVALCITPSGESNRFPVAQLWYVNATVSCTTRAESFLSLFDKFLFPELVI